jgi:hypothetical protein
MSRAIRDTVNAGPEPIKTGPAIDPTVRLIPIRRSRGAEIERGILRLALYVVMFASVGHQVMWDQDFTGHAWIGAVVALPALACSARQPR